MKRRAEFPGIAAVDLLIGLLIGYLFLFRLSVMLMNVDASQAHDRVKNAALYILRLEWGGQSADDLDLYLSDPIHGLVFFKRLSDHLMTLDHDDTGQGSNKVTLPDGRVVVSAYNEETVEIRGIIPGEYIAGIQCYAKRDEAPTKAAVTLYKRTSNEDIKVHDTSLTLTDRGQEITAFRFTLTHSGDVVDINQLPHKFVGERGAE